VFSAHPRISLLALLCLAGAGAAPAVAQTGAEAEQTQVAQEIPDAPDSLAVSPGGAFLRSLALPAWGHASIGSGRGAFYTLTEGASAWMIVRLRSRISSTENILALREAEARAVALAGGTTDEGEILDAIDADEGVLDARRRLDAREQQREDWIALAIFSVLLSGVDAYVSAHLQDFPEMPDPIETRFAPSPWGGVEFGAHIRLPFGW